MVTKPGLMPRKIMQSVWWDWKGIIPYANEAMLERSRRKMRQVVPYVSPSCCERRRIDSSWFSCTLPATATIFSSLCAEPGLFGRISSNNEYWLLKAEEL